MKHYKTVILRSTQGNKVNIPKDVWSKLGWSLNDKLEITFTYHSPFLENGMWDENAEPSGININLSER